MNTITVLTGSMGTNFSEISIKIDNLRSRIFIWNSGLQIRGRPVSVSMSWWYRMSYLKCSAKLLIKGTLICSHTSVLLVQLYLTTNYMKMTYQWLILVCQMVSLLWQNNSGSFFTKWTGNLPQDLVKSRSNETGLYTVRMSRKIGRLQAAAFRTVGNVLTQIVRLRDVTRSCIKTHQFS